MGGSLASQDPFRFFYTWWRGDPLPELPSVEDLSIKPVPADRAVNAGVELDPLEIQSRIEQGHHLYIAHAGDAVVGWGWSTTSTASIGELGRFCAGFS